MRTRVIFLAGLLSLSLSLAAQAPEPWFGTWRLVPEKSTSNADSRYKRVTLKLEPAQDGMLVTYEMVGIRGGITHLEWSGKFDGKDYPVQGVDYVLTNAYSLLGARSYQIVVKVDGTTAAVATVVVSEDGKTLTTSTIEKNASGKEVKTTAVYERR